jgi:cytochrome c-type biogenesis protein CcmE
VDVTPSGGPRGPFDEEESADAVPPAADPAPLLDVTPRTGPDGARSRPSNVRRTSAVVGLVALVGALGVVLFNGLNDAALFYFNVDESLERRAELGDDRFRMQGNVIDGTIVETSDGVEFVITYGGDSVPVRHAGDPPELFSPDIPVIIEGRFAADGGHFESDEILIRHDNVYTEDHGDRLDDAKEDIEDRAGISG